MVPTRPFQRAKQAVPVRRVVRLAWTVGLAISCGYAVRRLGRCLFVPPNERFSY